MSASAINTLKAGDVHLWRLCLIGGPEDLATRYLDVDERQRAARFVHARDRSRYILAHAGLRAILAGYLGRQPAEIALSREGNGKPFLTQSPDLQFNLSHSSDMALVGISRQTSIGVDIESVAPLRDLLELAATVFSPAECRELTDVCADRLPAAFLTGWTRKEACLKAVGDGLLRDPQSIETGIAAHKRCVPVSTVRGILELEVSTVATASGYISAVAVSQGLREVSMYDWTWPSGAA